MGQVGMSRGWAEASRTMRRLRGEKRVVAVQVMMLVQVEEGTPWETLIRAEKLAKNAVSDISLGLRFVDELVGSVLDVRLSDVVSASPGEQRDKVLDRDTDNELAMKRERLWDEDGPARERRASR